jgi:hypothetical protein
VLAALVAAVGCGGMTKMGKVDQYVAPSISGSKFQRLALISGGNRGDRQVLARARERLTGAGVTLVKRAGTWQTNADAVKEICTARTDNTENVDGVVFVDWDTLTLHECETGVIATNITGSYAGIDVLVDRLIRYLRVTPQEGAK